MASSIQELLANIPALTIPNIISYHLDFQAGIVGGGGLGTLAYYYGYQRYEDVIMWVTVIVLILFVQLVQMLGDKLQSITISKRR
jgi:D-methionine transport system permease protein